jgi:outer membrane protein assembly factor BamB
MTDPGRRTFLATAAAGTASILAGCGFLSNSPVADAGSDDWAMTRGTPGNTGASASGGPSANASKASTLELEDGISIGRHDPIVGADGVYAVGKDAEPYSHDPPEFALHAYRFDSSDGSVDWHRTVVEAEGGENIEAFRQPRASIGDDALYVAWLGKTDDERDVEQLAALDPSDGSVRWKRTYEQTSGVTEPAEVDGTLYRVSQGKMQALDPSDGSISWESDQYLLYQWGHPAVGDDIVVEYGNAVPDEEGSAKVLVAFDRESGEEVWTEEVPHAGIPEPTIDDGTVFVTEGDSFFQYGLNRPDAPERRLYAFDAEDGSERWSFTYDTDEMDDKLVAGGTSFVTVDADHAYLALGFANAHQYLGPDAASETVEQVREELYHGPNVFALDRESGDVAWQAQVGDQAQSVHPPIVDEDSLYVVRLDAEDEGQQVHVLDRSDGTEKGSFGPLPEDADAAVADGALYAHGNSEITVWRDDD